MSFFVFFSVQDVSRRVQFELCRHCSVERNEYDIGMITTTITCDPSKDGLRAPPGTAGRPSLAAPLASAARERHHARLGRPTRDK